MSALCLAVALGSAMPTGNLPAQAETLGVSHEAIFLSIALFVVGFGVGPLLFAPREYRFLCGLPFLTLVAVQYRR